MPAAQMQSLGWTQKFESHWDRGMRVEEPVQGFVNGAEGYE